MTGGIRQIFEIANGLEARGNEVTITALRGDHSWFPLKAKVNYVRPPKKWSRYVDIWSKLKSRRTETYFWTVERISILLGIEWDFVKLLTEAIPTCDINVASSSYEAMAVYRSKIGVPFYLVMDYEELVRNISGSYGMQVFSESLHLPFHFMTVSTWLKEWLKENYNKDAVVIGSAVNQNVFYPRKGILDGGDDQKVMGIFKYGYPNKGERDLICALNMSFEKLPKLNLIAVGRKSVFDRITKEVKPNFPFLFFESPSDDELAKLYSSANLFVYSSHVEGFGLPPLEAMACGTPVVTTDCLGVREYAVDGYNTLLVPPKDPNKLSEAISKLLIEIELTKKIRQNGLNTAGHHNWNQVVDCVEKYFKNTLVGIRT